MYLENRREFASGEQYPPLDKQRGYRQGVQARTPDRAWIKALL